MTTREMVTSRCVGSVLSQSVKLYILSGVRQTNTSVIIIVYVAMVSGEYL